MTLHDTEQASPTMPAPVRAEFPHWLRRGLITAGAAYAAAFVTAFIQVMIAVSTSGLPDTAQFLFPGAAQLVPLAHFGGLGFDGTVPVLGASGVSVHLASLFLVFVESAVVIVINWRAALTMRERLLAGAVAAGGFVILMAVLAASLPLSIGEAPLSVDVRAVDVVSVLVAAVVVFGATIARGLPVRARLVTAQVRSVGMPLVVLWVLAAVVMVIVTPNAAHTSPTGSLTALIFPAMATASLAVFAGGVADFGGGLSALTALLPDASSQRFSVSVWNSQLPILWVGVIVFAVAVVTAGLFSAARQHGRRSEIDTVFLIAVFGLAGVVVQLFGTITADVSGAGLGTHVTAGPAAWTFLIFLLWGGVAEVSARFLAPRLSAANPGLAVRVAQLAGAAGFAAPEHRPFGRRALVAVVAVVGAIVLVIGVSVAAGVVRSVAFGPSGTVTDYFNALQNGDAEKAVVMLGSKDAGTGLFTNSVYRHATDRPSDAHITNVTQNDNQATVEVTYREGSGNHVAQVQLRRTGTDWLIADRWAIVGGVGTSTIDLAVAPGINSVDVMSANQPVGTVTAKGLSLGALPGTYTFQVKKDKFMDVGQQTVTVDPNAGTEASGATFSGTPTAALDDAANKAITAYLQKCAASTDSNPSNCPIQIDTYWSSTNIGYTLDAIPHATVSFQNDGTLVAVSDSKLQYSFSYDETGFLSSSHVTNSASTGFRANLTLDGDTVTVNSIDNTYDY